MSEDEARQKWCPMVQFFTASDGIDYTNMPSENGKRFTCIASDCMAWRFSISREYGYCGLAGKPHG